MGTQERQAALHEVVPGKLVTDLRFSAGGGARAVHGLREGVVPETSPLAGPNNRAFVGTDQGTSHKVGEVAILLEDIHEGRARLDLEPRVEGVDHNVRYLRELVSTAMQRCDVRVGELDSSSVDVPVDVLEHVGFRKVEQAPGLLRFAA